MNAPWKPLKLAILISLLALVPSSDSRSDPQPAPAIPDVTTVRIASGLTRPIYLTAPKNDPRLFVVQQGGRIRIIKEGQVLPISFLNISTMVSGANEQGLLGLAFDPSYDTSGLFYIHYTDLAGDVVIARYQVSGNPDVANASSAEILLTVAQPWRNHNAGQIAFGPDSYLYISLGDGGGGTTNGDPNFAQADDTLLGKMLRIDVSGGLGSGYSVPTSNPYVGKAPLDEIWSRGFRNPYRWSFDRSTGDLYVGDVGQGSWEEIDVEPSTNPGGRNYGWPRMEGFVCYSPASGCNDGSLTLPVHAYSHGGGRCSVTGGYVYRGRIEALQGLYFFADYCSNNIWTFIWDGGGGITDLTDRTSELAPATGIISKIAGFGEDGFGELYIIDRGASGTGEIYRIVEREFRIFKN